MYLRKTQRRNKDGSTVVYYALAHNARDPVSGKVKADVLYNFGRADQFERDDLVRLCRSIARVCDVDVVDPVVIQQELMDDGSLPDGVDLPAHLRLVASYELGPVYVVEQIWERLGIGALLRRLAEQRDHTVPFERALLAMVANRLSRPTSKLGVSERWLERAYVPGCEGLELAHFYRAMDLLHECAAAVERHVFMQARNLFSLPVDVIFYDTTTASFEIDDADAEGEGIRRRGHSKDGGWNPQVVIALAVTQDGIPVRSWVLPGNTSEVTTIETVKKDLASWKLGRVLFVGDSGMNSSESRRQLSEHAGRYLMAARAGSVKEVKEEVLGRRGRYQKLDDNLWVKQVDLGPVELGQRYFVCYNPKEAKRQKERREQIVADLREELDSHRSRSALAKWAVTLRASQRTGRYLSVTKGGNLRLDMAKVRAAERLDGKWVLQTNDPELTSEQAARGFKAGQVIERCFAKLKSLQIAVTPMYHRVPRRIEAHVKICVLALALQRLAERESGQTWSFMRHALSKLQAVKFETNSHVFLRTTELEADTRRVLKKLKISPPKRILDVRSTS